MIHCKPPTKKLLLMQQFISIVLVFRTQIYQTNIFTYYLLLFVLFIAKYFKEGNTIGSVLQYVATILMILSDVSQIPIFTHIGIIIVVINYFGIAPTLYTLPQYRQKVGFKDTISKLQNKKQYYVCEWYPIDQKNNHQQYRIKWNHTIQMIKMSKYIKLESWFGIQLFKFFNSNVLHHQLTFYRGTPKKYHGLVLFSHGRGGTPMMYSTFLKYFAKNWKILSPQHSQVHTTPFTVMKQIKKYRQNEVKERALQIVNLANTTDRLVLMGHSYGCGTVLQAYYSMSAEMRRQVSHIVLLDPWLFPLTDQVFNQEILCPIIILANQYFLKLKDVNERNKRFVNIHKQKLIYICWKNGDHLHQTDLVFISGNSLGKIKNAKEGWNMMQRNIQAIQMFLQCQKINIDILQKFQNKYGKYDLGIQYKVDKWSKSITF